MFIETIAFTEYTFHERDRKWWETMKGTFLRDDGYKHLYKRHGKSGFESYLTIKSPYH